MKRSNDHVRAGILFVVISLVIGVLAYQGLRGNTAAPPLNDATNVADNEASEVEDLSGKQPDLTAQDVGPLPLEQYIIGQFAEAAPAGRCDGAMWRFSEDGSASLDRDDQHFAGQWRLDGTALVLMDAPPVDENGSTSQQSGETRFSLERFDGGIIIDGARYHACAG